LINSYGIDIDIIKSKLWIQHDGTELGVANNQLAELGIPAEDIVFGLPCAIYA